MYKQLQDILNKCIEKGWNRYYYVIMADGHLLGKTEVEKNIFTPINIHELFSKDSGLMEFVERGPMLHIIERYEIMGPMTAEEKVKYFIENAIR